MKHYKRGRLDKFNMYNWLQSSAITALINTPSTIKTSNEIKYTNIVSNETEPISQALAIFKNKPTYLIDY